MLGCGEQKGGIAAVSHRTVREVLQEGDTEPRLKGGEEARHSNI